MTNFTARNALFRGVRIAMSRPQPCRRTLIAPCPILDVIIA
jgi:hypothetical protein